MSSTSTSGDSPRGLALAVATYVMWGFLPLFMKALAHVPPTEVIAHRVLWSLPIALAVLLAQRRWAEVGAALRQPRLLVMAVVTAALISVNWMIYVWAVGNNHALDAALGYYINPLFSVFLGAVLLRERLSPAQWAAIALAAGAVAASVLWFTALGYGARLLARVLADPKAWRVVDVVIAVVMAVLAVRLIAGSGVWG
mgnify:CR=1 FL=1